MERIIARDKPMIERETQTRYGISEELLGVFIEQWNDKLKLNSYCYILD
jgi:hypothetical protein